MIRRFAVSIVMALFAVAFSPEARAQWLDGKVAVKTNGNNFQSGDQLKVEFVPLEMINERFARIFRVSLYNLLRRSPEIAVAPIQVKKFSEYVHTLHVPTSLNLVKLQPLRGTAKALDLP